MRQTLAALKKAALWLDRIIEIFAVSAVAAMVLIATLQVFTRKVFEYELFWSGEITLLLLIWFTFLGIAIGFRDHLHLAMDSFTKLFPAKFNKVLDKIIALTNLSFGYFLLKFGWEFTVLVYPNKMTATEWSSSVMYVVMPITGILVGIYSILHLLGIDTDRHKELEEVSAE